MSILGDIRNKTLKLVMTIIDNKLDGKEITKNFDKMFDEKVGEEVSEHFQRGLITNTLIEILKGLWDENPEQLRTLLITRFSK